MTEKKPGRKKRFEETKQIIVRIDPITEKKLEYLIANSFAQTQSEVMRKLITFAYDGLKEAKERADKETYLKDKENENGTQITS